MARPRRRKQPLVSEIEFAGERTESPEEGLDRAKKGWVQCNTCVAVGFSCKKKFAWSLVYDRDKQIHEETARIKKYEERIPNCQAKDDQEIAKVADLQDCLDKKKAQSAIMMESSSKARKRMSELEQKLYLANKERIELEQEYRHRQNNAVKMGKRIKLLEQQISDTSEQQIKDT
ncbi:hypothetical protein LXL04_037486 [Taraxacum kok-saghyz]